MVDFYQGIIPIVKGEKMKVTKVGVDFVSSFTRQLLGDIVIENEEVFLQAEYLAYDSGILFLKAYESNGTPEQVIELMAGCFEEGCNLQELLKDEGIFEELEELKGIVMSVNSIPVMITHYNYSDATKLYKEWRRKKFGEQLSKFKQLRLPNVG